MARRELDIDKRKAVVGTLAGVALGAVAFAALGFVAEFGAIADALASAELVWLAAAPIGLALTYLGAVPAWREVARAADGPRIGWWTATRVVALRSGGAIVVAGGAMAVDAWAFHRAGTGVHDLVRRIFALDMARLAVLGAAGWLAAGGTLLVGGEEPLALTLGWLVGPLAIVAAAWAATKRDWAARVAGREPDDAGRARRWLYRTRRVAADVVAAFAFVPDLFRRPPSRPGPAVGFAVFWVGNFLLLYLSARSFGIELTPPALVLAFATAHLVTMVPLPAGASGGVEATLAWLFSVLGAPLAAALPAAFVFRLLAFWLPIAVALAFAPTIPRLAAALAREGGAEDE